MSVRSAPTALGRLESPTYENWEQDSPISSGESCMVDSPTTASTPDSLANSLFNPLRKSHMKSHHVPSKRPYSEVPKFSKEYSVSGLTTPSPVVDVEDVKISEFCDGVMFRKGKNSEFRRYNVSLSLYTLSWERRKRESRRKTCCSTNQKKYELQLHDVLGACSQLNYCLKHMFQKCTDLFKLRVYTYKKLPTGGWKNCYYIFYCDSLLSAQEWAKAINLRLRYLNRPKRVQVFVNPFSGEGAACKLYNTKIAHIFQIAGMTTTVTVTERAGHARDVVADLDCHSTDAIVCVGGDGLFNEVFNSLFWKQQKENFGSGAGTYDPEHCPIKIGLIPAGSTNGVVICSTGTIDPVTSALQIAIGREVNIDLISVWFKGRIERFATNFIGYGFLGDVLRDSEYYRWMGPTRYDFSGFKTLLNLGSYPGTISFKEGFTPGTPIDRKICKQGCTVCQEVLEQPQATWSVIDGEFASIDGCVMSCCSPQVNQGLSPAAHLGDGCLDLIVHRRANMPRYLKYLLNVAFSKPFSGDLVDVYRVTEFKFKADCESHKPGECSSCSNWNIDGELYHEDEIHVKVHRQCITILAQQPD